MKFDFHHQVSQRKHMIVFLKIHRQIGHIALFILRNFSKKNLKNYVTYVPKCFKIKYQFFFLLFVIVLLYSSCFEPTEGCLDIEATNFDASADEQCESCCTFPELKISIFHAIETQTATLQDTCVFFSADSTFTFDSSSFQITDFLFYLSDFRLTTSTGEITRVSDTIQLNILDNAITLVEIDTTVIDDFVLIKRSSFNYTIGEFIAPGDYEKIEFKVGLDPRLNTTDPDTLSITHPLSSSQDMHTGARGSGYILQKFGVIRDTLTLPDDFVYDIVDPFSNTVEISLDYSFSLSPGFDASIPLKVNYSRWLSGIDFVTDDEVTIKSKIVSNTAEAISISE